MKPESYQDDSDSELESLSKEQIEARLRDVTDSLKQLSGTVPPFRHQDDNLADMINELEVKKRELETKLS